MEPDLVQRLRDATAAYNDGDVEPFVSLLHDDLEWRGISRGKLWWKHTPQ